MKCPVLVNGVSGTFPVGLPRFFSLARVGSRKHLLFLYLSLKHFDRFFDE